MKTKNLFRGVAVAAVAVAGTVANAAVDTTAITAAITDAGAAVAVIGAAVVAMHYGMKVWKWIKSAG